MNPNKEGNSSEEQQNKESEQGLASKANKAPKRKLPLPSEETEPVTVIKKRRHSADDIISCQGRELPWTGKKCLMNKFSTMPQCGRKRRAPHVSVCESWQGSDNKRTKLSDASTAIPSLRRAEHNAQQKRQDQCVRKRQASPGAGSESWPQQVNKKKRLSCDTDASHNNGTPSLCGEGHTGEGKTQQNTSKERSHSSTQGYNESLSQDNNLPNITSEGEYDEEKLVDYLSHRGVCVFDKCEVKAMTDAWCEVLGEGAFGSAIKTVDLNTHHHLVIKTFFDHNIISLLKETDNLLHLQMEGVQRLAGVCVENCQIISYFAGITAYEYFQNTVPLAHTATIFLGVVRACMGIINKGYVHNDLHMDNICVSSGSSGPVATIIDLGLACPLGTIYRIKPWFPTMMAHEAKDIYYLGNVMDRLLRPDKNSIQHPLVCALIRWMRRARQRDPRRRPSLAALEKVLEALLEAVCKATPQGTLVKGEHLVIKMRQDASTEVYSQTVYTQTDESIYWNQTEVTCDHTSSQEQNSSSE